MHFSIIILSQLQGKWGKTPKHKETNSILKGIAPNDVFNGLPTSSSQIQPRIAGILLETSSSSSSPPAAPPSMQERGKCGREMGGKGNGREMRDLGWFGEDLRERERWKRGRGCKGS